MPANISGILTQVECLCAEFLCRVPKPEIPGREQDWSGAMESGCSDFYVGKRPAREYNSEAVPSPQQPTGIYFQL